MAQHKVTLRDGRSATIETKDSGCPNNSFLAKHIASCEAHDLVFEHGWEAGRHKKYILASIEGTGFQIIRKSLIAPSNKPRWLGTFGELMVAAA